MNKAQHTPAPWKIINGSKERLHIGTFSESVGLGNAAEANARLIAAAPELLEALERIAAGNEMRGSFSLADVVVRYQEIARAAIAKAKGE